MENNNLKAADKKALADKKAADKKAKKKGVKYYFKSAKELGFKKRNFHTNVGDGITVIIADQEVDEKTYNKFSSYCKEVFFKS